MEQLGADTDAGLLQRLAATRSTTTRSPPSSCTRSPSAPPTRGLRIAYEALAWGRHVDDVRPRVADRRRRADHPALGICLDSFHILSRGADPAGDRATIPGEKIFFLQLADAPQLVMDVLQWSRHYRCFPGQGGFDLAGFLAHVLAAGYAGPLSLEVFNDVFRQADPRPHRGRRDALAAAARGGARRSRAAAAPPARSTATRSSSSASTPASAGETERAAARARASPAPASTAPSRCSCGEQGDGPRRCSTHGRRRDGRGVAALAVESADPARSARARRGAARAGARRAPRARRGRPRRGRRARRHVGVLLPHRRRSRRLAATTSSPLERRRRATAALVDRHRPRRARPAVRLLRRGGPVLPLGARPGAAATARARRARRAGPQPRGRPAPTAACGSRSTSPVLRRRRARRRAPAHRLRHATTSLAAARALRERGVAAAARSPTTTTTTSPPGSTSTPSC